MFIKCKNGPYKFFQIGYYYFNKAKKDNSLYKKSLENFEKYL